MADEWTVCLTENKSLCGWILYLKYINTNVWEYLASETETVYWLFTYISRQECTLPIAGFANSILSLAVVIFMTACLDELLEIYVYCIWSILDVVLLIFEFEQ
jgi:hypothetical protein